MLSFVSVTTDQQFRDLLLVRNECRDGLTHMTEEITLQDQKAFMQASWGRYEPYLLYDYDWPIGYGLLKADGKNKYWMTAGLVKEYRGKGLSKTLIAFITQMGARAKREVWIDVYDDNLALFGDIAAGYEFISSREHNGGLLHIMKYNPNRLLREEEQAWLTTRKKRQEILEVDQISRDSYA